MLTSMKGEINNNTIIVENFNTPLIPTNKQKNHKETQTLNDTIDQLDLIDIYRTFHLKTMNFTFSSSAQGTFSRIYHILSHKSSLGKFKKIEIIPSNFSCWEQELRPWQRSWGRRLGIHKGGMEPQESHWKILEHLPPKPESAYFLLCALTYTSDFTGGCPPLPLSEKKS